MDGYEYEAKVLWPKWNKDRSMIESKNASGEEDMRITKRLKDELGIVIPKDPIKTQLVLHDKIIKNPDNFYPELSPDYELIKSTKKSKWG